MPSSREKPKNRPRWRRGARIVGLVLLGFTLTLVLLSATLLLLARSNWGLERIRLLVLDQARTALPGLSIERIEGNLTGWINLKGLVLNERHGRRAITIQSIALRYRLLPLLRKTVRVESLTITAPRVFIENSPTGELNLANLLGTLPDQETPQDEAPLAWQIILPQVILRDGFVQLPGKDPITLREIGLKCKLSASAEKLTLVLHSLALQPALPLEGIGALLLSGKATLTSQGIQSQILLKVEDPSDKQRTTTLQLQTAGPWRHTSLTLKLQPPQGGNLRLGGWADLTHGSDLTYALTARLAHFDPHGLLPLLPTGDLNLSAKVHGQGIPLQPKSKLKGDLQATRSNLQGTPLDRVQLEGQLEANRWIVSLLKLRAADAYLRASGSGTLEQFQARVRVQIPRLEQLPLPVSTPRIKGRADLEAKLSGPFTGPYAIHATLHGAGLEISSVRVGSLKIKGALEGVPSAPRGLVQIVAQRLQVGQSEIIVDHLSTDLLGDGKKITLFARARGKQFQGEVTSVLRPYPDRLVADLNTLKLKVRHQSLRLTAPVQIQVGRHGELTLSPLHLATLGGQLSAGEMRTREGRIGPIPKVQFTNLRLLEGLTVSGELSALIKDRKLHSSLHARFKPGDGQLSLEVQIPLPRPNHSTASELLRGAASRLTLQATHLPLSPLAAISPALSTLGGKIDLSAHLNGNLSSPAGEVTLQLREGTLLGLEKIDIRGELSLAAHQSLVQLAVKLAGAQLLTISTRAALDIKKLVAAPDQWLQLLHHTPFQVDSRLSLADLTQLPSFMHQGALKGSLTAQLKGQGSLDQASIQLEVKTHRAQYQSIHLEDLSAALDLNLSPSRITADFKLGESGSLLLLSKARVDQGLWPILQQGLDQALPLHASLLLPGLSLARLKQVGLLDEQLSGILKGKLTVTGTWKSPLGKALFDLSDTHLMGVPLGTATASATWSQGRLAGALKIAQPQGGHLNTTVSYTPQHDQLKFKVEGRQLQVGPLARLYPLIKQAGGAINLDLQGIGPPTDPELSGTLTLEKGKLRLEGAPLITGLSLQAKLSPRRFELRKFSARVSDGQVHASGAVDLLHLRPRGFSLNISAKQLKPRVGLLKGITFDSPIRISGSLSPKKLLATIRIERGSLLLPNLQDLPNLHGMGLPADVVFVKEGNTPGPTSQGTHSTSQADTTPELDLTLQTAPLLIKSEQVAMEVNTDLQLLTDSQGQMRLIGGIHVQGGWIELMKNRYTIRHLHLVFNGSGELNPSLNLRLARQINSETIFIELSGSAQQPHISLRSEPTSYNQTQILSMILTGRVDRNNDRQADPKLAIISAISQAVIGNLAQKIIPAALIDTAKIDLGDKNKNEDAFVQRGESLRARAELGRHLTKNIYIGYRRVIGATTNENTNEGVFEYSISNNWFLEAIFGDAGAGGIDLIWTTSY